MGEAAVLRLPPEAREALAAAARTAAGGEVYLVGGLVRDLELGRASRDVDLVVVGDAPAYARRLAAALGAAARVHAPFSTADFTVGSVLIDVATARRERYPTPACLPEIEPAGLDEDLARRDFAINAMALPVAGLDREPLDPHGGRADLAHRRLRVLHDASFRDDPTRILRGVELATRLDFALAPATARQARAAAARGYPAALSASRLREAWRRLYASGERLDRRLDGLATLGFLEALGVDAALGRAAPRLPALERALGRLGRRAPSPGDALLVLAAGRAAPDEGERLAARFGWPELAAAAGRQRRAAAALAGSGAPHALEQAVAEAEDADLLALAAGEPGTTAERAWSALAEWRPLRLTVSGGELVAAGHPPGPRIGAALDATRAARLDGRIEAAGELEFALEWLRGGRSEAP